MATKSPRPGFMVLNDGVGLNCHSYKNHKATVCLCHADGEANGKCWSVARHYKGNVLHVITLMILVTICVIKTLFPAMLHMFLRNVGWV